VPPVTGENPETGELEERKTSIEEDFAALAFKIVIEEGRKLTYIRVYAGKLRWARKSTM
jgi:elongation factor G